MKALLTFSPLVFALSTMLAIANQAAAEPITSVNCHGYASPKYAVEVTEDQGTFTATVSWNSGTANVASTSTICEGTSFRDLVCNFQDSYEKPNGLVGYVRVGLLGYAPANTLQAIISLKEAIYNDPRPDSVPEVGCYDSTSGTPSENLVKDTDLPDTTN